MASVGDEVSYRGEPWRVTHVYRGTVGLVADGFEHGLLNVPVSDVSVIGRARPWQLGECKVCGAETSLDVHNTRRTCSRACQSELSRRQNAERHR